MYGPESTATMNRASNQPPRHQPYYQNQRSMVSPRQVSGNGLYPPEGALVVRDDRRYQEGFVTYHTPMGTRIHHQFFPPAGIGEDGRPQPPRSYNRVLSRRPATPAARQINESASDDSYTSEDTYDQTAYTLSEEEPVVSTLNCMNGLFFPTSKDQEGSDMGMIQCNRVGPSSSELQLNIKLPSEYMSHLVPSEEKVEQYIKRLGPASDGGNDGMQPWRCGGPNPLGKKCDLNYASHFAAIDEDVVQVEAYGQVRERLDPQFFESLFSEASSEEEEGSEAESEEKRNGDGQLMGLTNLAPEVQQYYEHDRYNPRALWPMRDHGHLESPPSQIYVQEVPTMQDDPDENSGIFTAFELSLPGTHPAACTQPTTRKGYYGALNMPPREESHPNHEKMRTEPISRSNVLEEAGPVVSRGEPHSNYSSQGSTKKSGVIEETGPIASSPRYQKSPSQGSSSNYHDKQQVQTKRSVVVQDRKPADKPSPKFPISPLMVNSFNRGQDQSSDSESSSQEGPECSSVEAVNPDGETAQIEKESSSKVAKNVQAGSLTKLVSDRHGRTESTEINRADSSHNNKVEQEDLKQAGKVEESTPTKPLSELSMTENSHKSKVVEHEDLEQTEKVKNGTPLEKTDFRRLPMSDNSHKSNFVPQEDSKASEKVEASTPTKLASERLETNDVKGVSTTGKSLNMDKVVTQEDAKTMVTVEESTPRKLASERQEIDDVREPGRLPRARIAHKTKVGAQKDTKTLDNDEEDTPAKLGSARQKKHVGRELGRLPSTGVSRNTKGTAQEDSKTVEQVKESTPTKELGWLSGADPTHKTKGAAQEDLKAMEEVEERAPSTPTKLVLERQEKRVVRRRPRKSRVVQQNNDSKAAKKLEESTLQTKLVSERQGKTDTRGVCTVDTSLKSKIVVVEQEDLQSIACAPFDETEEPLVAPSPVQLKDPEVKTEAIVEAPDDEPGEIVPRNKLPGKSSLPVEVSPTPLVRKNTTEYDSKSIAKKSSRNDGRRAFPVQTKQVFEKPPLSSPGNLALKEICLEQMPKAPTSFSPLKASMKAKVPKPPNVRPAKAQSLEEENDENSNRSEPFVRTRSIARKIEIDSDSSSVSTQSFVSCHTYDQFIGDLPHLQIKSPPFPLPSVPLERKPLETQKLRGYQQPSHLHDGIPDIDELEFKSCDEFGRDLPQLSAHQ